MLFSNAKTKDIFANTNRNVAFFSFDLQTYITFILFITLIKFLNTVFYLYLYVHFTFTHSLRILILFRYVS